MEHDNATYNRLQEKYEDSKATLDRVRQDFEDEIQVRMHMAIFQLYCLKLIVLFSFSPPIVIWYVIIP